MSDEALRRRTFRCKHFDPRSPTTPVTTHTYPLGEVSTGRSTVHCRHFDDARGGQTCLDRLLLEPSACASSGGCSYCSRRRARRCSVMRPYRWLRVSPNRLLVKRTWSREMKCEEVRCWWTKRMCTPRGGDTEALEKGETSGAQHPTRLASSSPPRHPRPSKMLPFLVYV